jgi:hypothetical protein
MASPSDSQTTRPRPAALFKYLAPKRLEALEGWLRCSPSVVLNDVFEMTINYAAWSTPAELEAHVQERWPSQLEAIKRRTIEASAPMLDLITQRTGLSRDQIMALPVVRDGLEEILRPFQNATPFVAKALDQLLPTINDRLHLFIADNIGAVSFSEDPDSLLMWAHYGAKHQGYVIEYLPEHEWFDQRVSPDDEYDWLRPVRYQQARAALVATQSSGDDMFLTKSSDWEYEREWRVLFLLKDCEVHELDSDGVPVHRVRVPRQAMKRVILGCRMTPETRRAALEHAAGLEVHEAVPHKDRYAVEIRPLANRPPDARTVR